MKDRNILDHSNTCSIASVSITKGENTMTKKHFEAIAEDINKRAMVIFFSQELTNDDKHIALHTLKHVAYDLGSTFSKFNNNFDYDKFIKACAVAEIKEDLAHRSNFGKTNH